MNKMGSRESRSPWGQITDTFKEVVRGRRHSKEHSDRYGTVRYGTVRYGTVRYGTVRVRFLTRVGSSQSELNKLHPDPAVPNLSLISDFDIFF